MSKLKTDTQLPQTIVSKSVTDKEFINFKYTPKKYFSGYTECLIIDPIPYCYN